MRIFKLIGVLAVVLAFNAIAVAAASAEEVLWRWLPGSAKETFKGEIPEVGDLLIIGGGRIECKKGKILLAGSELLEKQTLALATIHFEGCKAEGLVAANSLGDASEVILVHIEIHNCIINKANKEFGLLILPLPVHIEIPATKLLIEILEKGLFVAKIEATGTTKHNFLILAKQTKDVQEPKLCEGGKEEMLEAKVDAEPEQLAAILFHATIEFDLTIDTSGEEIME